MDALTCTTNGRILVVDDNAQALRAMSELLQFEGFSVLTAKNGLDALNKMKAADHISLVLLDLWMPVMDGWEVLRRKRSDADIAEIPVVVQFLRGYRDRDEEQADQRTGDSRTTAEEIVITDGNHPTKLSGARKTPRRPSAKRRS